MTMWLSRFVVVLLLLIALAVSFVAGSDRSIIRGRSYLLFAVVGALLGAALLIDWWVAG